MSEWNQPYGGNGSPAQPGGGQPGQSPGQHGAPMPSASTPSAAVPSDAEPQTAWQPAPGSHLSTAQVGETLKKIGIGNPLPTFIAGAVAYIVALLASLLVIASAVAAALTVNTDAVTGGTLDPTGGSTTPPSTDGALESIVGLLGIPFQLVSLASFGSYEMQMDLGFFGSFTVSWRGLPLLITIAMVVAGFLLARLAQRRWSSNGVLGAALWSGISGLSVAIVAVIIVRLTAFSYADESLGMSLSMHSAGADMFFGPWALITVPLFLGHLAGLTKPRWWPLVADLAAGFRLALVHALAFAIPVGILGVIGGAIGLTVDGDGDSVLPLLLSLPIWGPTALALLPGLGMLVVPVRVSAQGDVESLGLSRSGEYVWFYDLPWYVWVPMVLIALVVPLLIAVLWNRDREIEKGNVIALVASWAALPLAYMASSLVLLGLVWTSAQAHMGMMGSIAMHMGLALWMPLLAFVIGAVIEVVSRFGAPYVDRFVPGLLVNWFRRSARARRIERGSGEGPAAPGTSQPAPFFPGV